MSSVHVAAMKVASVFHKVRKMPGEMVDTNLIKMYPIFMIQHASVCIGLSYSSKTRQRGLIFCATHTRSTW